MKRFISVFCLCCVLFFLVSCTRDDESGDLVHMKLTGSFAVTVRELIPDYCLDDVTPTVAVVTCFQDAPFTLYVGEEMASQMTVGERYVFEIEETDLGEIPRDMPERYPASPEAVISMFHVKIANIRPAEDEEWGLDSIRLAYVEFE